MDVEEVEDDDALVPLTLLDLETDDWGNSEDGIPGKSEDAVVMGVAVEG